MSSLRPWFLLNYPPNNVGDAPSVLYDIMCAGGDDVQSVLLDHQLAEWWEEQRAKEDKPKETFPWDSIVLHKLDDDVDRALDELNEEGKMHEWLKFIGQHAAMLIYQRVSKGSMTDSKGVEFKIVVWGLVEKESLSKLLKLGGEDEPIGAHLKKSARALHPHLIKSPLQYVQYGSDRWIYPQVTARPEEYGEANAKEDIVRNHDKYEKMYESYVALVHKLCAVEREFLAGSRKLDSTTLIYQHAVREDYFAKFDFSNPAVRVADLNFRVVFFFYTVISNNAHDRAVFEGMGARLLKTAIEVGWPQERHVAYFAMRTRRDDYRVSAKELLLSSGDFPPLPPPLQQQNRPASQFLAPFVMLPGDTLGDLESRFKSVVRNHCRRSVPFFFDVESSSGIFPALVIADRMKDDDLNLLIGGNSEGKWTAAPAQEKEFHQAVFDPFPTRLYFFVRGDKNEAKASLRKVMEKLSAESPWKHRNEGERWLEETEEIPTDDDKTTLVIFPRVVFRSLEEMRNCLPDGLDKNPEYADRTSFEFLRHTTPDRSLQPSLEQLSKSLSSSSPQSSDFVPISARPFSERDIARALQNLRGDVPQRVWIRPEACFASNPRGETADDRGLPLVGTEDSTRCEGRIVTHKDFGYWLSSEYRIIVRSERHTLETTYGGDAPRWMSHAHKIDPARAEELKAKFSALATPREHMNGTSHPMPVIVLDDEQQKTTANNRKQRAKDDEQLPRAVLPGESHEERQKWNKFADSRGHEFTLFLCGRDSITTTPDGDTFIWHDKLPGRMFGGKGAYQLTAYLQAVDVLGEGTVSFLEGQKERRKEWEKTHHWNSNDGPQRWPQAIRVSVEMALKDAWKKAADPDAPLHSQPSHIYTKMQEFYVRFSSSAAGSVLHASHPRKVDDVARFNRRAEMAKLYDTSSPIDDSIAAVYLREKRELRVLSPDILERSPFVRFHPAMKYRIKQQVKDGESKKAAKYATALFPTLICFCADKEDAKEMVTCQNIYLNPDTKNKVMFEDKGKINKAKKSDGFLAAENSFFFVQPGRLEIVPIVFLAEGPETAWSVAAASRYLCVYCSFGAGNFGRFAEHRTDEIAICLVLDREKDEKKRRKMEKLFDAELAKLQDAGWKKLMAVQPDCDDGCKDFNEMHQKHGIKAVRNRFHLPPIACTTKRLPDGEYDEKEWNRYRRKNPET